MQILNISPVESLSNYNLPLPNDRMSQSLSTTNFSIPESCQLQLLDNSTAELLKIPRMLHRLVTGIQLPPTSQNATAESQENFKNTSLWPNNSKSLPVASRWIITNQHNLCVWCGAGFCCLHNAASCSILWSYETQPHTNKLNCKNWQTT